MDYQSTIFHNSCAFHQLEIVQYLCEKQKINKDAQDSHEWTGFHWACANSCLNVVKYLCEKQHINKEEKDVFGKTGFDLSQGNVKRYLKSL